MSNPADLTVSEASGRLARRELGAVELTQACLDRIRARDGVHSHDGDPASINAWVRVYDEDALAAAARADRLLAEGGAGPLCGIPIGLKDIFAVAGKPLTASSRVLDDVPDEHCEAWALLDAEAMVLLGHLHTHEFAAGGTTDQVGNPWALDRSAGGSSAGSAAALASGTTPAATGTDTAGSVRIPSAFCGISAIKPTRGLVSMRGVVPLAPTLDHAGPMARTVEDCALLLAGMTGERHDVEPRSLAGLRLAVSPRTDDLDMDVADGFDAALEACRRLGAELVQGPPVRDTLADWATILDAEIYRYHRRFDDRRELYRPSVREFVERSEAADRSGYEEAQARRLEDAARWDGWFGAERVAAMLEPTVPDVAWVRGPGYEHAGTDLRLILLTHTWDVTGMPVVALPAGVGVRSGLPVGVSLVGPTGGDRELLALGMGLQAELGVPAFPAS